MQKGFSKVEINGKTYLINEIIYEKTISSVVYLVIGRLRVQNDTYNLSHLFDSIETAFFEGNGNCVIRFYTTKGIVSKEFSKKIKINGVVFEELSDNLFNFNCPSGACPTCKGVGTILKISEDLVIPNQSLSLYDDSVTCWNGSKMIQWKKDFIQKSSIYQFPIYQPYNKLTIKEKKILWNGTQSLHGIYDFFKYIQKNVYKLPYKILYTRYQRNVICPTCEGKRLNEKALCIKIGGKNLADLITLSIEQVICFLKNLQLSDQELTVTKCLLIEIKNRLHFLKEIGLGYLTLNRLTSTLSNGECQRINLTKTLVNNLTGSLYILDEPSIGLHEKDVQLLIKALKKLQNLGNTIIIIEHDEKIISKADYMIDIGPNSGHRGGDIMYQGEVCGNQHLLHNSHTVNYLLGKEKINLPICRKNPTYFIELKGFKINNLKGFDVRFPLNAITAVTGVSGSGKSSLVYHGLYKNLKKKYEDNQTSHFILGDLSRICKVQFINQLPIGYSARSTPATYVKAYDEIRNLFANQSLSKQMQLTPSHFSFNTKGGRCEACKGEGKIQIDMQFMPDLFLECDSCHGKRFAKNTLEVKYYDKNIYDILNMDVDEAINFFKKTEKEITLSKKIIKKLQTLQYVGLGYIKLGQTSTTLSSGESQRIKLAFCLNETKFNPTLFIFDEPTTGLHFYDIKILLKVFKSLIDQNHTIVIVEHNLDLIKMADHIIDLGPSGGEMGGFLIASGTPEELINNRKSITGKFLKTKLSIH